MKSQIGARHLKDLKQELVEVEIVCTQHHMTESKLIRLPSGAVKRVRISNPV